MAFITTRLSFLRTVNCTILRRCFTRSSVVCGGDKNQPLSGNEMPRSGGIASVMRLPIQEGTQGLDACFVGIPFDAGTSNRSGTRLGPRQIRCESVMLRAVNGATGASPFKTLNVADVGDIPVIPYNVLNTCKRIKQDTSEIIQNGCKPLFMGGDHVITYPILQAMKEKYGKIGLIHLDAHSDTQDTMLGEKLAHGTPFFRAVEEDLLDCKRVAQIGLRGSLYSHDDYNFSKEQGFRVVRSEECWHKSLVPLMAEVREQMGDGPVYISFDIDVLDPSVAPGTGTPEIGGLTGIQGLEIIRGCKGLNVVGGDVVEVSPPYDPQGTTALAAANLLFEMLCILPGVHYCCPS